MQRAQRLPELDALKSAAIVTVVFIHSLRASWDPGFTYAEHVLSEAARFAVPAFLAVSGFLYYSDRATPLGILKRRLRRILFPYFVVSIAAQLYLQVVPQFAPPGSVLSQLLLASTFGPYYYVFLLTEFVLATYLLSRMPRSWVLPVFAISCFAATVPFLCFREGRAFSIWTLRLPLLSSCWFMMGWAAAAHEDTVRHITESRRGAILAAWGLVVVVWFALDFTAALPRRLARVSTLLLIGANIAGLYTLFRGIHFNRPSLVALSERTYAVYLLHLFFVYTVFAWYGPARNTEVASCAVTAWIAGIAGSLLVIEVTRRLLPKASRDLVGY